MSWRGRNSARASLRPPHNIGTLRTVFILVEGVPDEYPCPRPWSSAGREHRCGRARGDRAGAGRGRLPSGVDRGRRPPSRLQQVGALPPLARSPTPGAGRARGPTGRLQAPDTGCTLCDLHECLVLVTRAVDRLGAGTLAQLTAEGTGDPELREELMEVVVDPPRREVHRTLHKARERGDLAEHVDLPLTVDVLASLTFYRQLLGEGPMTSEEIESVVTALLRGIASDYEELVRVYGEHEAHEPG